MSAGPLEIYSTEALIRELERRADGQQCLQQIERWCDDCTHFRHSTSERDTRNNCTRGHEMSFREPEEHNYTDHDAWGFYRRGCGDWCPRPDPAETRPPLGGRPVAVPLRRQGHAK